MAAYKEFMSEKLKRICFQSMNDDVLMTVPPFVTVHAHTFGASEDDLGNSDFLRTVPTNTKAFYAADGYAGKAVYSYLWDCLNHEKKWSVLTHFSEIIELLFKNGML